MIGIGRALIRRRSNSAGEHSTGEQDLSREPVSRTGQQLQCRLNAQEIELVVAAYEAGLTLPELSTAFGADRRTLSQHLQRRGVSRRGRRLDNAHVQEAAKLYEKGWSIARCKRSSKTTAPCDGLVIVENDST